MNKVINDRTTIFVPYLLLADSVVQAKSRFNSSCINRLDKVGFSTSLAELASAKYPGPISGLEVNIGGGSGSDVSVGSSIISVGEVTVGVIGCMSWKLGRRVVADIEESIGSWPQRPVVNGGIRKGERPTIRWNAELDDSAEVAIRAGIGMGAGSDPTPARTACSLL